MNTKNNAKKKKLLDFNLQKHFSDIKCNLDV